MSAFVIEDGAVYHTYSTYARGVDGQPGSLAFTLARRGETARGHVGPRRENWQHVIRFPE
jgi:hypothetical protein